MKNARISHHNLIIRQSIALTNDFWIVFFVFATLAVLLPAINRAEGTDRLEPVGAPGMSYCRLALAINALDDRIPFALIDCDEQYRLNIRIHDYTQEKIYIGFGRATDYNNSLMDDVDFQIKGPDGQIVVGYELAPLPHNPGAFGFIETRDQALNGPNIQNDNPSGYKPLVLTPQMNGDYVIEFGFLNPVEGVRRVLQYFDATVARGLNQIPGRMWSKAWQLSSASVNSMFNASFASFYIYSSDSITTVFPSNGLAGGIWVVYSNEWGTSVDGSWSDRRKSVIGNATVPPQYKIFINEPDPEAFPTGVMGEMINATVLPHVCDTAITFAATVSKGGNIEILIDAPPLNPDEIGTEDVQLGYGVFPGYNVLLPAWDGKDGNGVPIPNGTLIQARINFLNGLTNIPLHDVEDNPGGFMVDIVRPVPATGNTKLKVFWDDSDLPAVIQPTSNVVDGCVYQNTSTPIRCHDWENASVSLGNLNTINTWWYYSSEDQFAIDITLELLPRRGEISGPVNICAGQLTTFRTTVIPSAPQYIWNLSGPGFSYDYVQNAPDTTFTFQFLQGMSSGEYVVSVYGLNPECGPGATAYYNTVLFDEDPPAVAGTPSACVSVESQFSIAGLYSEIEWSSGRGEIVGSPQNNEVTIRWDAPGLDTLRVYSVTESCGTRLSLLPVVINPVAEAAFVAGIDAVSCPGLPLSFTDASTLTSGSIVKRKWSWDDGQTDSTTLAQIAHSFADTGFYTVRLVVTTNLGCETATEKTIEIIPYPEADFKAWRNCVSQGIELTDLSTGINLASWEWDFGNAPVTADNLNQQQPTAVFHQPGEFPVRMIVTNLYGCKDTVVEQVYIHYPPVAAFSHELACQSRGIVFTDESLPADTALVTYSWQTQSPLGDTQQFEGNPVTIIFDKSGENHVELNVTDGFGCVGSTASEVSVIPKPAGSFNYQRVDTDLQGVLRFENLTTGAVGYNWDFGNATTSTLFEPTALYFEERYYTIVLVSVSTEGCTDTTRKEYYYYPELYMPNAFTPDLDGLNDVFKPVTGRSTLEPYLLQIYNAWGQPLFSTTDPAKGWDGKHNGEACPTGVYVYTLDYREGVDGGTRVVSKKGTVTLVNR